MLKVHKNVLVNNGFVLNEKYLRRLLDVSKEQLSKASDGEEYQKFEVKYTNGAIEIFDCIENVLELDNSGASKICYLSINMGIVDQNYKIELKFVDITEDSSTDSIRYSVTGEDRDWLFITISQIEDRISLIERNKKWVVSCRLHDLMMFFLFGITISLFYVLVSINDNGIRVYSHQYDKKWQDFVEVDYKVNDKLRELSVNNPNLKPVEVFYEYQLILAKYEAIKIDAIKKLETEANLWADKTNGSRSSAGIRLIFIIICGALPAIVYYLYAVSVRKLYPVYVFCWGDNKDIFEKVERRRGFILVSVILTFTLSVAAGLFLDLI
ncbi:hypothetical protein ACRN9G_12635 [Shewanella frigidimarina]|uniref:hypothetical protein n=1 Tax=Shewanella frigidimarina TaxID=56812 RepID=UPI003D7B3D7D